jgi:hypothetical protein
MNKEFIPYEEALELKELGFDETCMAGYDGDDNSLYIGYISNDGIQYNPQYYTKAPLYQQVFRWFRDEHRIDLVIGTSYDGGKTYYLRIETGPMWGYQYFDDKFITYQEAELAALKKMIEIVKNK